MNGLGATVNVVGVGTVGWSFRDDYGVMRRVLVKAYLVPASKVRIFSPQQYFKRARGGAFTMYADESTFTFKGGGLSFKYDNSSLPIARGNISKLPSSTGYLVST